MSSTQANCSLKTQHGKQRRRNRTPWLDFEIQNLIIGVYNFGAGKWAIIHNQMMFQQNRTYIDLKDKWRNLVDHRHYARTSAVYRAVASIIQKQQRIRGHIKPERLLTKNDWQTILQMYFSKIQDEIENSGSSEDILDSCHAGDELEYKEPIKGPKQYNVISYPIVSNPETIPQNIICAQPQPVQTAPVVKRKFPTIQDFLW
jgi:hypothetical protein